MKTIELRQGDYLPQVHALFGASSTGAAPHETDRGIVVISQCCDLAKAADDNLPVGAKVVYLEDSKAGHARTGRQPRYYQCEHLGHNLFVDFGVVGAIELDPNNFVDHVPETDEDRRRALAARIGRRFTRFAYPNEIQPFFYSIQDRLRRVSGKGGSALGRCLDFLVTLRVETNWAEGPPWSLNLVFVLIDDYLPQLPESPKGSAASLMQTAKDVNGAALAIDGCASGDTRLADLWQRLGELIVDAAGRNSGGAVSDVTVEITDESDFSYARFLRSVDLDIDDLSES